MATSSSSAQWFGTLKEGKGKMSLGSGAYEGDYTYGTRFEGAKGTNPEELIGAASAGCFSMYLSALLTGAGFKPESIKTIAKVHLETSPAIAITLIELETDAVVPGLDEKAFQEHAEDAKKNCPVSKALTGTKFSLKANLH